MRITFTKTPATKNLLLYPLFADENVRDPQLKKILGELRRTKEFEGKQDQSFFLLNPSEKLSHKVVFVGLGDKKDISSSLNNFICF